MKKSDEMVEISKREESVEKYQELMAKQQEAVANWKQEVEARWKKQIPTMEKVEIETLHTIEDTMIHITWLTEHGSRYIVMIEEEYFDDKPMYTGDWENDRSWMKTYYEYKGE